MHGFLLVGGEKMSKTRLNQIAPADLVADFGVDGFRYHFLRDTPSARRRLQLRADGRPLQRRPRQQPRQPPLPRRDGRRPRSAAASAPRRDPTARSRRSPPSAYADATRGVGRRCSRRVALEATWRLVREANAHLEANEPWKAEPGPDVDAVLGDALEVLRIVAVLASPAIPAAAAEIWRRIGLDGSPEDAAPARGRRWGGYPGRPAGGEGRAAVPPHLELIAPMRWTDDHCHLPDDLTEAAGQVADARRRGSSG